MNSSLDFLGLQSGLPEYTIPPALPLADLSSEPPGERITGLLPMTGSLIISAYRKTGKSTLALDLAAALSSERDFLRLERELAAARRDGYAVSTGEIVPGASALAVPIFGPDGSVIAALGVAGPSQRWTEAAMAAHTPDVLDEAGQLMQLLASAHPAAPTPLRPRVRPRAWMYRQAGYRAPGGTSTGAAGCRSRAASWPANHRSCVMSRSA
jgi:hypothetical protein